jgi:hypothetical protein
MGGGIYQPSVVREYSEFKVKAVDIRRVGKLSEHSKRWRNH